MNLPSLLEAKKRSNKEVLTKTIDYITSNDLKNIGSGKKYFIKTYGCQMNEHDTENIKAILEDSQILLLDYVVVWHRKKL